MMEENNQMNDFAVEEATQVLKILREAQDKLLSAIFAIDDGTNLVEALTLIGDTMDGISAYYNLPIMSEQ